MKILRSFRNMKRVIRTSNSYWMRNILCADQEDNVPLRRVDIIILQEEDFVDTVLLKCRELNKKPDWPCKSLLNDQVFLSANLQTVNQNLENLQKYTILHTPSSRPRRSFLAFSLIGSVSIPG